MLYWLGEYLLQEFGDGLYRLFKSRIVLSALGLSLTAIVTWLALPRFFRILPNDRGRENAHGSEASVGKPTGAGLVFIPIFLIASVLVVPWQMTHIAILGCVVLALLCGYLDDRGGTAWGEYRKAILDVAVAFLAAAAICEFEPMPLWVPLFKETVTVPVWAYLAGATALLWISINATNCTDGVDGLSGSLLVLAYFYLGALLYGVVGRSDLSAYLLVPHDVLGANWGIMAFTLLGTLSGYLWFNAHPSQVLMGDAGSRPLGLMLGVLVLTTGNPFLILVVAGVVLINGGTGLVKVAVMRFFKIPFLRNIRFPLHDHCRAKLGWSSSQVLIRFVLLQAVLTPLLFVIVLKMR